MAEVLNIQYHRRQLTLKALNKYKSITKAAGAMGLSTRTLHRYIKLFDFKKDIDGSFYQKN